MNKLNKYSQSGMALLTAMIVILILTITAIAIGQQVIGSKKNTTVDYDHTTSYINAQNAQDIAQARLILNKDNSCRTLPDQVGTFVTDARGKVNDPLNNPDWWTSITWPSQGYWDVNPNNKAYTIGTKTIILHKAIPLDATGTPLAIDPKLPGTPMYSIEYLGDPNPLPTPDTVPMALYRITSRAEGAGRAVTYLRTLYTQPAGACNA